MAKDEERLVLLAQAGDPQAFDELIRRHEARLFRHVCRLLGSEEAAYDALQETYLALVRNIRRLRSRSSFRPWAYGVATRTCLNIIHRKARSRERSGPLSDLTDPGPLPESLASAHEQFEELLEHVVALSPKLSSVILLHFYEELTLKEVAAAMEMSIGTVKSRLAAGLDVLRRELEETT